MVKCASWILAVSPVGTAMHTSQEGRILLPEPPVSPITARPSSRARRSPASTFPDEPEVESESSEGCAHQDPLTVADRHH